VVHIRAPWAGGVDLCQLQILSGRHWCTPGSVYTGVIAAPTRVAETGTSPDGIVECNRSLVYYSEEQA
jgi:hypothetical protein